MVDDEHDRTVTLGKHQRAQSLGFRVIVVSEGRAVTHPLPAAGEISIGRFTGSKLSVQHHSLSRMHAIVRVTSEDMTIEDLGSENGTFVRELRVKPGRQEPSSTGDVVRVGDVILIFRMS
jgi:pSer/pThr/pTyr-binding forkhead associated (FHA) protein